MPASLVHIVLSTVEREVKRFSWPAQVSTEVSAAAQQVMPHFF